VPNDEEEEEVETQGTVYDDTKYLVDREITFKWGDIYHMFNN
jgi:hypothetical protein